MRLFVQVAESPLRTDCGQHVVMDRVKFQIVDWVNDHFIRFIWDVQSMAFKSEVSCFFIKEINHSIIKKINSESI